MLLSCIVWGKEWSGKLIRCHCDNMAVVEVLNSGYSRDREMMHLLRCLFFIAEHFCMQVEAVHLPGKKMDWPMHYPATKFLIFCRRVQITNPPPQTGTDTVGGGTARLDITVLDRTVCQLYRQGLAQSTQRAYASGKRRYLNFCDKDGDNAKTGIGDPRVKEGAGRAA